VEEHLIRLRGGWEAITVHGAEERAERINLPARLVAARQGRLRLLRKFGRPRFDRSKESLSIRMRRVPGVSRVTLNGRQISVESKTEDLVEFVDVELSDRNELVIEVEVPGGLRAHAGETSTWGEIALVVRPRAAPGLGPLA
jgi:hypothetical protein